MPVVDTIDEDETGDERDEQADTEWRPPHTWLVVAGITLALLKIMSIAGWPRFGVLKIDGGSALTAQAEPAAAVVAAVLCVMLVWVAFRRFVGLAGGES